MRILLALMFVAGLLGLAACGDNRPCEHWSSYYQPPTYVKAGNVIIPVGGGMVAYCDRRGPVQP